MEAPYRDPDPHLRDALAALAGPVPRTRDIAAAELGDRLRGGSLPQAAAELVVSRLVGRTVGEPDRGVRESALHSVGEACIDYAFPLELFLPLVPGMAGMDPELLGHTLGILGSTRNPAAAPLVRPFLGHADAWVREEAASALEEVTSSPAGA
ncbi:HEAT repeat domain-containing protein [Streptomyces chattanoogensis]|uniref:HEAT repeat domain-containing protein n=1 Tax=Streptomyces chattanoogensis TaxID=66876 RepID=UPI000AB33B46|nr:HEAT repeat domain-containing protein [Streptomyces chattanoogensis]